MKYEWNQSKAKTNATKHKVEFDLVYEIEWENAVIFDDKRKDYGELRQVALAPINNRLFSCVFTDRGDVRRIISLRKSNEHEISIYERETNA